MKGHQTPENTETDDRLEDRCEIKFTSNRRSEFIPAMVHDGGCHEHLEIRVQELGLAFVMSPVRIGRQIFVFFDFRQVLYEEKLG